MASTQEPEVQFAQRLASNEKPVRTRALKKLRKYVNVRSQKATGGFSADELLRLWKGLFYCLWMQDKPLLQEELSKQISSLILSFHDIHGQMLYLESFLQTCKREWTGIDRLRMDKFYQLVRFMFRQTFEALKRKTWESSAVASFLDVLAAQLLHSGSAAPCELQLHILDLYMTELAAVGSAELTADQNLKFIEPFCRTAARTKDRTLFSAICGSVFSTIIDQAPFAIEDLMKEVKAAAEASDSDSGQASEEDDGGGEGKEKMESKAVGGKGAGKQLNGKKSSEEDDDDDDDDELLHLEEDSDTELPGDEDIGPVLQFDFGALADKLFESASRSSTPGQNRPRLYRIIKVLRDLSEGIFPQDEYPEEVSTDEDDEMFGSRKRMKRGRRRAEDNEDSAPAAKKSKGKKKKETPDELNKDGEPADGAAAADDEDQKKKKKKKRKRKKKIKAAEGQIVAPEAEGRLGGSEEAAQSSVSSVTVTEAPTETLLLSEKTQPSVTVTEDAGPPPPAADQSKSDDAEPKPKVTEADGPTPAAEMSSEDAPVSAKKRKKKKKGLTAGGDADGTEAGSCEASGEAPETDAATPAKKKKKKGVEAEGSPEGELQVNGVSSETEATSERCEASAGEDATGGGETPTNATTPAKKKGKRKKKSLEEEPKVEADVTPASQQTAATPAKKTPKKKQQQQVRVDERETDPTPAAPSAAVTPQKKKMNRKEEFNSAAGEDAEKELEEIAVTTPATRRKKKKNPQLADETQAQVAGGEEAELPLNEASSGTPAKKKKRKVPVVFEFEADELEAAAAVNGLAEEEEATPKKTKLGDDVGEPSTPLSRKKSQKKTKTGPGFEFITFKSKASTPTPLFCRTKGGLNTPLSRKKSSGRPTAACW
ncbi:ribosomal RNA processing protein 1 homolog A-like isoform X2 [Embiotoca jacksoni]|uniref:ribosomal RNA processing protein 1 homolog A-like isoform X2 n=1 Tax=Embiotoca jacksoni TaxID=100190 RepID=UPI00370439D1